MTRSRTDTVEAWIIVGLGNPGRRYQETRHNVGFVVLNRLTERLSARPQAAPRGDFTVQRARQGDKRDVLLVKPMTYMNASGAAVKKVTEQTGIVPERILVIYDCLDLPLGRIRLRPCGSSGGQRGVESVIRELGTDQFPRLRVGIGRRPESMTAVDYVLSEWTAAEKALRDMSVAAAADAVIMTVSEGLEQAMNRYNGWKAAEDNAIRSQGESSIENV